MSSFGKTSGASSSPTKPKEHRSPSKSASKHPILRSHREWDPAQLRAKQLERFVDPLAASRSAEGASQSRTTLDPKSWVQRTSDGVKATRSSSELSEKFGIDVAKLRQAFEEHSKKRVAVKDKTRRMTGGLQMPDTQLIPMSGEMEETKQEFDRQMMLEQVRYEKKCADTKVLEEEVTRLRKEVELYRKAVQQAPGDRTQVELERVRGLLMDANATIASTELQVNAANSHIRDLETRLAQAEGRLEQALAHSRAYESQVREAQAQAASSQEELGALSAELQSTKDALQQCKDDALSHETMLRAALEELQLAYHREGETLLGLQVALTAAEAAKVSLQADLASQIEAEQRQSEVHASEVNELKAKSENDQRQLREVEDKLREQQGLVEWYLTGLQEKDRSILALEEKLKKLEARNIPVTPTARQSGFNSLSASKATLGKSELTGGPINDFTVKLDVAGKKKKKSWMARLLQKKATKDPNVHIAGPNALFVARMNVANHYEHAAQLVAHIDSDAVGKSMAGSFDR